MPVQCARMLPCARNRLRGGQPPLDSDIRRGSFSKMAPTPLPLLESRPLRARHNERDLQARRNPALQGDAEPGAFTVIAARRSLCAARPLRADNIVRALKQSGTLELADTATNESRAA